MEFKGISWAGNIYQKFEDMCLEVEEAMYQDTVKYVENQVQKVGFSVKKFCSAVTDDLVPPSFVYPVNLSSGDFSLASYGDIDVIKKPIPSIFDTHHELKKKENKDQAISIPTAEKESPLNGCYDIKSLLAHSKSRAPIRKKAGVQKNPIGIKRISRNNHPSKNYCRTNSVLGERIELASNDMRSSSSVASDDRKLMSTSDLDVRRESEKAVRNKPIPDAPIGLPASNKFLTAESLRPKEDDQDFISPASGKLTSTSDLNVRRESEKAVRNTPISDAPIGSPASNKFLTAESLRPKEDDQDFISPASGKLTSTLDLNVRRESEKGVRNTPISDAPIGSPASNKILTAESLRPKEDDPDFISPASGKLLSTSDLDVRRESEKAVRNTPISDAPIGLPAINKIRTPESLRQKEDDQDFISPASGKPSSAESVRQNKDNSISPVFEENLLAEPERLKGDSGSTSSCSGLHSESTGTSVNDVVMVSDEGTSMKDISSIVSITAHVTESRDKETINSDEDGFDMEFIEDDEFAEPRLENSKREKLDDSCVMVEGNELHSLPQGTRKHMSYKKKIREAFNLGGKTNDEVVKEKVPADDSFESDWELL